MDKKKIFYATFEAIGRNWDIQDCMDIHIEKMKSKDIYESRFGLCLVHSKKAKFICYEDTP